MKDSTFRLLVFLSAPLAVIALTCFIALGKAIELGLK